MLRSKFSPIYILLISFILFSFKSPQEQGKFRVEIEGLRNEKGSLLLAIYQNEKDFLKDGRCYRRYEAEIVDGKSVVETDEVPYGEYSIGIMHDENGNGRMDLTLIKLPKEGFGFSNNPTIRVKKPTFKETKVNLQESVKELKIKTKYLW